MLRYESALRVFVTMVRIHLFQVVVNHNDAKEW